MQGLINSGMRAEDGARSQNAPQQPKQPRQASNREPTPPRRTEGASQPPRQGGEDAVNMNPENAQEQRNVLVNSMLGQLYGPQLERAANILQQSGPEPMEGIGRVVSGLLGAAYKSLRDDGRSVPPGVLFQAGMMASQAVGEMAMRMGILDEGSEAEAVESGFMMALGTFGRAKAEQMSDQERERYAELIDGMEAGKRMAMESAGGQPNAREPAGNSGMMAEGGV